MASTSAILRSTWVARRSSFAAETRSSTSTTATLKDFVLGQPAPAARLRQPRRARERPWGRLSFPEPRSPTGPLSRGRDVLAAHAHGQRVVLPLRSDRCRLDGPVHHWWHRRWSQAPRLAPRRPARLRQPPTPSTPRRLRSLLDGTASARSGQATPTTPRPSATLARLLGASASSSPTPHRRHQHRDWLPNDSATITSAGGTALNGSLSFTLYSTTTVA